MLSDSTCAHATDTDSICLDEGRADCETEVLGDGARLNCVYHQLPFMVQLKFRANVLALLVLQSGMNLSDSARAVQS